MADTVQFVQEKVSTRALLLDLENNQNNTELDYKSQNLNRLKGNAKCKMESNNYQIPKKPKNVGWTNKRCILCKKHGGIQKPQHA